MRERIKEEQQNQQEIKHNLSQGPLPFSKESKNKNKQEGESRSSCPPSLHMCVCGFKNKQIMQGQNAIDDKLHETTKWAKLLMLPGKAKENKMKNQKQ